MLRGAIRTLRFGRSWVTGRTRVRSREVELDRGDRRVPGTLLVPEGADPASLPGWIVLHGMTRPGRRHPELVRFTESLASSGAAVLLPQVPEWVELDLAPHTTTPTVRASVRWLREEGVTGGRPVGLIGFSFGAPQALATSVHEDLRGEIGAVVGFGGYCHLERTFRFMLTGRHELDGEEERLPVDPYGRWIVAAALLPAAPGFENAGDAAAALRDLAVEAGDRRIPSGDPALDPSKERLRGCVAEDRRWLFDLFAPPTGQEPDMARVEEMLPALRVAARIVAPELDPVTFLDDVSVPVHLVHGREDVLIPYTESIRLARRLEGQVPVELTVTGLFAHSKGAKVPTALQGAVEGARFANALRKILAQL